LIRKAVFPAAGLGTRFLPATKAQPKEMLPLVDKPVIQYVIEEAVASGIEHVILVTGRGKNAIEDHFDVSYELERVLEQRGRHDLLKQVRHISDLVHITYVRQKEALGLGHAILMAREVVGDEPFAVFLGDDVIDAPVPCMKQLMQIYKRFGSAILAVEPVAMERTKDYGIIAGSEIEESVYKITNLVEKPHPSKAPSNLAIIGRYILTPDIFEHLERTAADRNGEIQLTNGLHALLLRKPMYAYRFQGTRYDTGNKLGFLRATVEFALQRPDLGAPFRRYLKSLKLGKKKKTV
jgi:UTP--glucose-1-phosphate uridylyltransferase